MKTLDCGHSAPSTDIKLCHHLIGKADVDFFRILRGESLKYDVCCKECAELAKSGESVEFVEACAECVQQVDGERWNISGWIGTPGIEEQLETLDYSIETIAFPVALAACKAVLPLDKERVLAFDGQRIGIFTRDGFSELLEIEWPQAEKEGWRKPLSARFHVSPNGRFAVLANDYGRFGVVFDLIAARITMSLDRGEYHPDTQPFPVAFFENDGRQLVVHGSNWNRLEISDPASGELLSSRDAMVHSSNQRPEHDLDFFHGRLTISPDGKWIADDGWVWHPVGEVVTWNLEDWLERNPYESEDGDSRKMLCYRDYLWDVPVCWIDNSRLAVWGIGEDDIAMIDAVRIFDVKSGEEINQFSGPTKNAFWSDGKRLFSNEMGGLHVWDVERGVRTGRIEGFHPDFHRQNNFIEVKGNLVSTLTF